ncbi:thrombospondin type-1 domain-containing protein 4-like isoform X2 [Littorina saxatilis]|uniref:thrombospondin type-1 domain-containing protein 4-like isoform X2 n=1 Tax=Littorina saxatilis TaxID=31220 RepID=UPI0038B4575D
MDKVRRNIITVPIMDIMRKLCWITLLVFATADVGCDGILGSGAMVDQCGICGGEGSTCRVISGIYTRMRLDHGYHHMTTIPEGACNINITELSSSRNYIALSTEAGLDIVNSNRQLRATGEYGGAGTVFDYRRRSGRSCPGVCIFADGPLNQPVEVKLLSYDRNPGIMYHFMVPQDTATAVMSSATSTHNNHPHHHSNHSSHHKTHHGHRSHQHQHTDAHSTKHSSQTGASSDSVHVKIRTRNSHRERHKHPNENLASLSVSEPESADDATASLKDEPASLRRREQEVRSKYPQHHRSQHRQQHHQRQQQHHHRQHQQGQHHQRQHNSNQQHDLNRQRQQQLQHERQPLAPSPPAAVVVATNTGHETPLQSRSSAVPRQANVASAPLFVPPEQEGAPIEYRHYYHVDSDDYRRLAQTAGYSALDGPQPLARNEVEVPGGAGAEALRKPNFIPATRQAQRWWGSSSDRRRGGGGVGNSNAVNNAVGDVPLSVPASGFFTWTISGFTPCSHPCGGGTQQTVVVCMKSDTRVVVIAENCDPDARPSPTTVECNSQPCDARWTAADWSQCSVTCGNGVQTRQVECKQRISPTLHLSVSADTCSDRKPPVTQFCRRPPCFQWRASNWTKCSTNCGLGERTRTISCVSGEGQAVPAARCSPERPKAREICDMGSCAKGWYYTRWTKGCSPDCGGKTHKTRKVYCAADDGGTLPGDRCPADKKPRTRKACGVAKPCGGKWFSGPWSKCNSTCGEAWRAREVTCMKKHGRRLWSVVGKENCLRKERPPTKEMCTDLPLCQPEWYMTHWSECSKPCGTGSKLREVKCLHATLQPSTTCNGKRKPKERRVCNTKSCDNSTSSQHQHTNDYDARPQRPPERLQESSRPNTTYHQRYHRNRTKQPSALKAASAPAEITLQKDFRSAMGDASEERHDHHPKGHEHQGHRQHHDHIHTTTSTPTTNNKNTDTKTAVTTGQPAVQTNTPDQTHHENCTDTPNSRWCMFVSQARLCGYNHYKKRCCKTCTKYNLHH